MNIRGLEKIIDKAKELGKLDDDCKVMVKWYANSEWGEIQADVGNGYVENETLILEVEE